MITDTANLTLLSEVKQDGTIELRLDTQPLPPLALGEVRVRMEAAPINPSDLGLLLASADLSTAKRVGSGTAARLTATLANQKVRPFARRVGLPLAIGNEGTGTIVDAAPDVTEMIGRKVAMMGGAMYARYRTIKASECLVAPDQSAPAERAGLLVNPLTALAMVETMHAEGHRALVHSAAASNLGQMLVRICLADGIDLVNIVRSDEQAELLKVMGARYVVNRSSPDFKEQLNAAITETRATIAFDAIGGGRLVNSLLHAMEASEQRFMSSYNLYGSDTTKQVYIYGSLDIAETPLDRGYGYAWSVGAFLVTNFLKKASPEVKSKLFKRISEEYNSTFCSKFSNDVAITDLLDPEILSDISRRKTGKKYLLSLD